MAGSFQRSKRAQHSRAVNWFLERGSSTAFQNMELLPRRFAGAVTCKTYYSTVSSQIQSCFRHNSPMVYQKKIRQAKKPVVFFIPLQIHAPMPAQGAILPDQTVHRYRAAYFHPDPSTGADSPPAVHIHRPVPVSGSFYWQVLPLS